MRNAFVQAEFEAFRIDHDQANLMRRGFVEHRHDQRIEHDALARAGRSGDQQVRHSIEGGNFDSSVNVLAQGDRQRRCGAVELVRFKDLAQADDLALGIRHFDADGRFAGNALDQNRFGLQAEAQVFRQRGDARVFHACFRLELERRDDWPGIDLRDGTEDVEFLKLRFDFGGGFLEFLAVEGGARDRLLQQRGGRQAEIGTVFARRGLRLRGNTRRRNFHQLRNRSRLQHVNGNILDLIGGRNGEDEGSSQGARSSGSTMGGESGCSLSLRVRGDSATGSGLLRIARCWSARFSARAFAARTRDSRQARKRATMALNMI